MRPPSSTFRTVARLLALGLAIVALGFTMQPAQAYPDAFFHTQDEGDQGVDVLAIQYLLRAAGHDVPATGVFDSDTDATTRTFQEAEALDVDGIVGPDTWGALTPTVQAGDSGDAVRALQEELNAKQGIELEVNGQFDAATEEAVRSFQEHAEIGVDGIVGPETWQNLIWHYDYPDFAAGLCDQDPDGNGTANWGTAATIGHLEAAARSFAETGQGEVPLGDVSFELGGSIPGHASHQVGMDVDVWPIRTDSEQCSADRITWESAEYDRDATRQLVQAIRDSAPGHVALVFFNDPVLIDEGLTTEYPNHDNHLHVRYCEPVHPDSLYAC